SPASAVTLIDGPEAKVSGTTATINWSTDVASGTKVSFGTSADALTLKAEGDVTTHHTVSLRSLQPRTIYYYVIGSARMKLGTGSFTTTMTGAKVVEKPAPTEKKAPPSTRAPPAPLKAPPATVTWASLDSLPDHFSRHGPDFDARSSEDYAAQAWTFLQRARHQGLPMKWDDSAGGTLRVWDPAKRIFAAYTRAGKTRTFFKPGSSEYWNKQPGRIVHSTDLSF
ncbi:MAG: hypothetical protein JWO89_2526, partial [Verrucomicrobiaceae bacterium]|nr:hypothetical protein [Verrucomicrobiaceae bacterium]